MTEDEEQQTKKEGYREFLTSWLCLLVVLSIADGIFRDSRFSKRIDDGNWIPTKRRELFKSAADVVVVGSSVIAEGMTPGVVSLRVKEKTGKTLRVFNFGVSAGSYAGDFLIADSVLQIPAETRPRYFIISMSPMEFSCCPQVEVPSHTKWAGAIRFHELPGLLWNAPTFEEFSNTVLMGSFRMLAVRPAVLESVFEFKQPWDGATWPLDGGGGTIPQVDPATQNDRATHRAESFKPYMLKPKTVDHSVGPSYLRALVKRLAAGGVHTAFIGAPQAPQLDVLDGPDSIFPEYEELVIALAKELDVPYVSFRHMPDIGATDFADGDHLCSTGSVKFSNRLADEVLVPMMSRAGDQ